MGYDGAAVLLYETGKKAGEQWISRSSKEWGLKNQRFIEAVQNFYAELGWGRFNIKENNGKELIIRVKNSFIAHGLIIQLTFYFAIKSYQKPDCFMILIQIK